MSAGLPTPCMTNAVVNCARATRCQETGKMLMHWVLARWACLRHRHNHSSASPAVHFYKCMAPSQIAWSWSVRHGDAVTSVTNQLGRLPMPVTSQRQRLFGTGRIKNTLHLSSSYRYCYAVVAMVAARLLFPQSISIAEEPFSHAFIRQRTQATCRLSVE